MSQMSWICSRVKYVSVRLRGTYRLGILVSMGCRLRLFNEIILGVIIRNIVVEVLVVSRSDGFVLDKVLKHLV